MRKVALGVEISVIAVVLGKGYGSFPAGVVLTGCACGPGIHGSRGISDKYLLNI